MALLRAILPPFLLRPQGPLLTRSKPEEVVAHIGSRFPVLGYPGTVQLLKDRNNKVTAPKINWLMFVCTMFSKKTWVVSSASVMKCTV